MLKQIVLLILVTAFAPLAFAKVPQNTYKTAQQIAADKVRAYETKFTLIERQFLSQIAVKAVKTIDVTARNSKQQYDCVVAYLKDPRICPQGRDILDITKQRYKEYRQYYALGHMDQVNKFKSLPGAPPSDIIATPYSRHFLDFAFNEVDWLNRQRELDKKRLQTVNCEMTEADIDMYYHSRVTQIITSTPVVLMIKVIQDDFFSMFKARKYLPEDQDVVNAYVSYMEGLASTRKNFTTDLKVENMEGLFVYQMLAAQVVQDNTAKWLPAFESLNKKLLPQNNMEAFMFWAKNTFFSLNTLFIGCSVGATAGMAFTGFVPLGVIAGVCTTAAAGLAANTLIQDLASEYQMQQEWLAGIRDRGSVEAMRTRIYVDVILLAFNLYALKAITPASIGMAPAVPTAEQILAMNGANVSKQLMQKTMQEFIKEQGVDVVRGEMVALGFGVAFRELINSTDLDRVTQVSADILFQYRTTGSYTFASQANLICSMKAVASK